MNTLIIAETVLIIKDDATVQLRISAVLLRKLGRLDVPYAVKVFDPEFAFYGPIGYDVGNVIAHLVLAMVHSEAMLEKEDERRKTFREWALKSIEDIIDMFKDKYGKKFAEIVTDNMAKTEGFAEYYLEGILRDTSAVAGLEILRRIVGGAKVKDVTSIMDENVRAEKEEKALRIAKEMIMNRNSMCCGKNYKILVDTLL